MARVPDRTMKAARGPRALPAGSGFNHTHVIPGSDLSGVYKITPLLLLASSNTMCDAKVRPTRVSSMSFLKAIVILFALVSARSFVLASSESPEIRAANCESEQTRNRITNQLAENAVAEGKKLKSQGDAASLRKALESYEKAPSQSA